MRKWAKYPDEPEYDGKNARLNVDKQSYGEQSISDESENVTKTRDQEITKGLEILEKRRHIRERSKESER